jgi:hypothetical protein
LPHFITITPTESTHTFPRLSPRQKNGDGNA